MKIIIVYDIPKEHNDKRRILREYLKNYGGKFLQYSVYEAEIKPKELKYIIKGIKRIIKNIPCKILIIKPCKQCQQKIRQIGNHKLNQILK